MIESVKDESGRNLDDGSSDDVVLARPIRMSQISVTVAVLVVLLFLVTSVVMRTQNAGASFTWKDQIATAVIGPMLAALILTLTRPRLRADGEGVHLRGFFGSWKTVPWDVIRGVEFPRNAHFARVVLPAEETMPIFAVQRMDKQQAVDCMRGLRRLFAAAQPND